MTLVDTPIEIDADGAAREVDAIKGVVKSIRTTCALAFRPGY
jgi:hypothetical protein